MNPVTRAAFRLIIRAMLELIEATELRGKLPPHLTHAAVLQTLTEASALCDVEADHEPR